MLSTDSIVQDRLRVFCKIIYNLTMQFPIRNTQTSTALHHNTFYDITSHHISSRSMPLNLITFHYIHHSRENKTLRDMKGPYNSPRNITLRYITVLHITRHMSQDSNITSQLPTFAIHGITCAALQRILHCASFQ